MKKAYTIKNTLVKDHVDNYSYNLTSKIDAEKLCTTLNNYHEKTITNTTINEKLEQATKSLIEIQMTMTILQNDINKLKEALK